MNRVCTPAWLTVQYRSTTYDAGVAGALVLLALSQPPSILRRFWSPALTRRVESVLCGLASDEAETLSGRVALLGAVELIGLRVLREPFAAAHIDRIGRLPLDVLPHRVDADGIEPYQRNLWLGLRVIASRTTAPLIVGRAVIDETLSRWQISLRDSAAQPEQTPHRLDQSMIAWLEACALTDIGTLLPSREPLWLVTGFRRNPTAM